MTELERQLSRARYDHRDSAAMVAALDKLAKAFSGWSADEPLQKPDSDAEEQRKLAAAWLAGFGDVVKAWSESVAGFGLSQDESEVLDEVVAAQRERAALQAGEYYELRLQVTRLLAEEKQLVYRMRTLDGREAELPLAQVVRASRNNELGTGGRAGVYFSKLGEFLFEEPREANTEGGIFPVIIGTLIMTVLMSLAVVPFGVIAALYLREYAKQGPLVSAVRIAVNNLAGVPSIVFGIFGLGFLCTLVGGQVDHWLFPELLPSPTFGGGGILWASLTLALLTVPVVIVATEESLISVPASQREASLATGASRWQTIQRVILPQALPGILTGAILAMARGAGEVAPLMLVGAVKNAPALPVDGSSPYVHMERKFMHLGFHIYDIGFQSPDVDGTKPLVFTTTLVLLALIGVLNITAIRMRNKLRKRLKTSHV
ncbi:MAG: phosphate ABC transporter permease PstA [Planctomycetes bacterium]|nr:phosphate ABC transporter permease PstA [Planctomycetota bacterium]